MNTENVRRSIGVLWSGDHLFEGTVETLEMLRSKGQPSSSCPHHREKSYPYRDRQTNRLRNKQQHQIPRRLQDETRKHGYPLQSRTPLQIPQPCQPPNLHINQSPKLTEPTCRTKSSAPPTAPQSTSPASSPWPHPKTRSSSSAKPASKSNYAPNPSPTSAAPTLLSAVT